VQLAKQKLDIVSTDEGIQIDCSDEQEEKADSPRFAILEPDANVKFESCQQLLKQVWRII
jgi:hypothetical protein